MKMVKRPTLRHQTAWELEPHDVLERECFNLRAGDILVTKCIGDRETPVSTHRLGDYAPTDIRVRELTKWQEGISQIHASGFMARHRQREQDEKNLTASGMNLLMKQQQQQQKAFEELRRAMGVPPRMFVMQKIGVDLAAPDADMTAVQAILQIARADIVESPIDNPLADELFDALFGKPRVVAPQNKNINTVSSDEIAKRCSYVRPSDVYGCMAMEEPESADRGVIVPVKSNVKPAIAGLYTMTPVLAFNSKRDCRI